jgi:hypothetical protein
VVQAVDELAAKTAGKKSLAMSAFARALRAIPTTISDNAGRQRKRHFSLACKEVQSRKVCREVQLRKVCKEVQPRKVCKEVQPRKPRLELGRFGCTSYDAATESHGIQYVLFGMQNRKVGRCWAAKTAS